MIELRLGRRADTKSTLSLFFKPLTTEIAAEYILALSLYSGAVDAILEPDRTYNFPGDRRGRAWIAKQLNHCIDVINSHSPGLIKHRAKEKMEQPLMNELHHYFERYRGSVLKPASYFRKAPFEVREALHAMNILIHRYEDQTRTEEDKAQGRKPSPRIVVTFKAFQRAELADADYPHFTKKEVWGRWYIDYCELGKPLWDVYQDKDEVVGEQNIRPLRYFSANALIHFGPTNSTKQITEQMKGFNDWWIENEKLLARLGFKKSDPKNSIGAIPVADLLRNRGAIAGLNQAQAVRLIGKYPVIKGVVVHPD